MTKKKCGQPTKYKPEYCEMLIAHMSTGLSFDTFAAVIDVNLDTLYEWAKVHEAFSEAKKTAFNRNLLWWEKQGNDALWTDPKALYFNATVWIFNMKNRHRWRDRHDLDVKTTPQEVEREKIRAMPTEQLAELVKADLLKDK